MIFFAIDLYGISPFPKPIRIPLKPGLNLLTGSNGAGKSTVHRLISVLLLNAPAQGFSLQNGQGQAAISFQASDGATYRIAADFVKMSWVLARLDNTGKGALVEKEHEKICDWLLRETKGCGMEALSSLFLVDRNIFSASGAIGVGATALLPAPTHPSPVESAPSEDRAEKEKELQEAERKLEDLSKHEAETLDLNDRISNLRRRIEQLKEIDLQLARFEEVEVSKFGAIMEMGPVTSDLLQRYEEGVATKRNETEKLTEEIEETEGSLRFAVGPNDPLKDRLIQIGIGVTVVSFLLPIFITLRGMLSYLFLVGMVAGIGLSIFSYFKFTQRIAEEKGLKKKRASLNDKLFQLDKKFEKEHKGVIDFLKRTGAKETSDLKEFQRAYNNHLQNKKELSDRKALLAKGDTIDALEKQHGECAKRLSAVEENLRGFEGLNQEVYRLREELRRGTPGSSAETTGMEGFPLASFAPPASLAAGNVSLLSNILTVGRSHTLPFSLEQAQKEANFVYSQFAPGNKEEISLKETGEILLGERSLDQLSSGTSEQLLFSVLLAALDQFADVPFPLILDDPFVSLDPKRREVALELLRGVSKKRQVVFFTVHPLQPKNTDHHLRLGGA